jgi:hypothetical protein
LLAGWGAARETSQHAKLKPTQRRRVDPHKSCNEQSKQAIRTCTCSHASPV